MNIIDMLRQYRAERAPVVVNIKRIDDGIRALVDNLGIIDTDDINNIVISRYIDNRTASGLSPMTVRRELCTLKAALNLARDCGHINRVVRIISIPATYRSHTVDADQIDSLIGASTDNPRGEAFLRLLLATAGRRTAVCELTWDRVDLGRGIINLKSAQDKPSRRKHRAIVPISDRMVRYLSRWRDIDRSGAVRARYPSVHPDTVVGLTPSGAYYALRRAARRAGIDGVSPHIIRHSVATLLLRQDVSLIKVSRMLGHASVATTADIYGHLSVSDLRGASDILAAMM